MNVCMTVSVNQTIENLERVIPEEERLPGWQEHRTEAEIAIPGELEILKPRRTITNDDILEVLQDAILGDLCNLYASATRPPLPLEVSILKAIVSAACALSEKGERPVNPRQGNLCGINVRGSQLTRLCINTAGG